MWPPTGWNCSLGGCSFGSASFTGSANDQTASCQLRELDRGLARLPEEQRAVILLVGLEGVRYDEAAAILNVPIGTVRSRLFRGRKLLGSMLRDHAREAGFPLPTETGE